MKTVYSRHALTFMALVSSLITLVASTSSAGNSPWVVKKTAWSATDEKNYANFVEALGQSGCNTVDKCLKSKANPYRLSDPQGSFFDADCGKFPYLLRGYFAWKNGLPFSYANGVAPSSGVTQDIRYSPNGNMITSRRSVDTATDGYRALKLMQEEVDTAMYRVHPARDQVDRGIFSDFYAPKIDRGQIHAGTVIYDAAGHVVNVYKVESDGRVRYFDAHPDKTVSHGVFGEKFARSRVGVGAGFKDFRSLTLVGAQQSADGTWHGGSVTTAPIEKTPGFSVEQYFGTEVRGPSRNDDDWKRARYVVNGQGMSWFDFVRVRLALGDLKFHPVEEMQNAMDSLCGDIQDRVVAVQTAIDSSISKKDHPAHLPMNIYGTDGDWESFSSPSRDARLKTSFKEVRDRVQQMVELFRRGDSRVVYHGADLGADLRAAYAKSAQACTVTYRRSNGQAMRLDYDQVLARLFELSFDPYNCAELRWGATDPRELATCPDSTEKHEWFRAEQRLRNQIDRPYDVKMGFSLRDLETGAPGSGLDHAPGVDLLGYLQSI